MLKLTVANARSSQAKASQMAVVGRGHYRVELQVGIANVGSNEMLGRFTEKGQHDSCLVWLEEM